MFPGTFQYRTPSRRSCSRPTGRPGSARWGFRGSSADSSMYQACTMAELQRDRQPRAGGGRRAAQGQAAGGPGGGRGAGPLPRRPAAGAGPEAPERSPWRPSQRGLTPLPIPGGATARARGRRSRTKARHRLLANLGVQFSSPMLTQIGNVAALSSQRGVPSPGWGRPGRHCPPVPRAGLRDTPVLGRRAHAWWWPGLQSPRTPERAVKRTVYTEIKQLVVYSKGTSRQKE